MGEWEGLVGEIEGRIESEEGGFVVWQGSLRDEEGKELVMVLDVDLGWDVKGVVYGLFVVLRELDRLGVDIIFVEGVSDGDDIVVVVMNCFCKVVFEIRF